MPKSVPFERQQAIIEFLSEHKRASIEDLIGVTGSSLTTLRRDINDLVLEGMVKKLRGGVAFVTEESPHTQSVYLERQRLYTEEKDSIALSTQECLHDGDIVFLSYGSTTSQVAKRLDTSKRFTILTNGLDIVDALRGKPNVQVIFLGGAIDYANNISISTNISKTLNEFNPKVFVLGAGGITEEKGITSYDFLVSAYYLAVARCKTVRQIIVVADHSKFGRNELSTVVKLKCVDTIVTDWQIEDNYRQLVSRYSIDLIIAPKLQDTKAATQDGT